MFIYRFLSKTENRKKISYHILAIISLVHVVTYDWFRSVTPHMVFIWRLWMSIMKRLIYLC